jgi:hypothetical protein
MNLLSTEAMHYGFTPANNQEHMIKLKRYLSAAEKTSPNY